MQQSTNTHIFYIPTLFEDIYGANLAWLRFVSIRFVWFASKKKKMVDLNFIFLSFIAFHTLKTEISTADTFQTHT